MVDRALKYGASRLNFVPTHYYLESSSGDVTGFCYMDGGYNACTPFNKAGVRSFQEGLAHCLAHVQKQRRGISHFQVQAWVRRMEYTIVRDVCIGLNSCSEA